MNAAITFYSAQWLKLVSYVRTMVAAGPSGIGSLFIGVNNNFNQICPTCPGYIPAVGQFDLAAMGALYNAVDFIALSAYAPLPNYQVCLPLGLEAEACPGGAWKPFQTMWDACIVSHPQRIYVWLGAPAQMNVWQG